jgi:hypothetical protein
MSKYGVYIIEFLRAGDHDDGFTISEILKLSKIECIYKYAHTKQDFVAFIKEFEESDYRYLHISCHADKSGFEIDGGEMTNEEISVILNKSLNDKRLFLSACEGANRDLASRIITNNKAYSLIGTPISLRFDKSILFWSSFYHLINEVDSDQMKREEIINVVKDCVRLFNIPINYYSRVTDSNIFIRRLKIRDGNTANHKIRVSL